MAYFYQADIEHLHEITTTEFSMDNLKFIVGNYDITNNVIYSIQGEYSDNPYGIHTFNAESPLTPFYAISPWNYYNTFQGDRVGNVRVNPVSKQELYNRIILVLMNESTSAPECITDATEDMFIVTNIAGYNNYVYLDTTNKTVNNRAEGTVYNRSQIVSEIETNTTIYKIVPYIVTVNSSCTYIYRFDFTDSNAWQNVYNAATTTISYKDGNYLHDSSSKGHILNYERANYLFKYCIPMESGDLKNYTESKTFPVEITVDDMHYTVNAVFSQTGASSYAAGISVTCSTKDINMIWANYGLYFGNDVERLVKPIIEGGIVTGYSLDHSTVSEIDDYTDFNHDVPKPGEDPEADFNNKIEDMKFNMTTIDNTHCFRRLYALNSSQLSSLEVALASDQTEIPTNFDPMQNIVGLSVYPFSVTNVSRIGANSADATMVIGKWNTGLNAKILTSHASAWLDLGSIKIPRMHKNAFDFAPYTQIYVYVPYCGEVQLPTNLVVGSTITVRMIYDIPSGSCKAVVKADGAIVAEIGGNFSSSIGITSSGESMRRQALLNSSLAVAGGVVGTAVGIASATSSAQGVSTALGGAVAAIGGVTQEIATMNRNFTTSKGASDAITNFYMPNKCYLKYVTVRPRHDKYDKKYGHTVGFVADTYFGTIGEHTTATGRSFTIFHNIDTSGIQATQAERDKIKALLESGVYI